MCYSINSSYFNWVKTFLIGICLLIMYNDYDTIWVVSFILVFSQIQIFESIAWANMDHINNNKAINSLLILLLLLQPIVNTIFAYKKTKNKKLFYLLLMLIISLIYLIYLNKNINIKPGVNGHLTWLTKNNKFILNNIIIVSIYLIGLLYPFVYLDNNFNKIILISFGVITFIYSLYNYYKSHEFSSYWCHVSTTMMIILAITKLIIKT